MENNTTQTPETTPEQNLPAPKPAKSNKKLILIIACVIAALVVVGGAYGLYQQSKPTKNTGLGEIAEEDDHDEFKYEAVVSITKDGFNPATITVRPGTRILFENKDSVPHRIMPTQGGDVEKLFEAKEDIAPGSGYGHSFDKKGTFNYHDSQNPTFNGTVIVE